MYQHLFYSQAKLTRNDKKKKVFSPLIRKKKIKRKFTFFSVNTKRISSHVFKISAVSLVKFGVVGWCDGLTLICETERNGTLLGAPNGYLYINTY